MGFLFDGKYQIGAGEEVGEGGLSLLCPFSIDSGRNLIVTFALENEMHVMRGEVRYQTERPGQGFILGIAFHQITFQYKRLIRRYIGAKTEVELKLETLERTAEKRPV